MVAAFRKADNTLLAPGDGASSLCSIKTNFVNLIHQADLQINGKTIESTQPFINVARHFQLLSEMSINDLQSMGHSLGFSPTLDSTKSMQYVKTYAGVASGAGNGLTNNRPFGAADNQIAASGAQNNGVANSALQYKIGRYLDTTTAGSAVNGLVGNIVTKQQLVQEFRPYYDVLNTNYAVWYDFAVIKLSHLFESLGKMGLVRRFDATLRLWVNTGTVNIAVTGAGTGAACQYALTPENNTFSNTCPLMLNWLGASIFVCVLLPLKLSVDQSSRPCDLKRQTFLSRIGSSSFRTLHTMSSKRRKMGVFLVLQVTSEMRCFLDSSTVTLLSGKPL